MPQQALIDPLISKKLEESASISQSEKDLIDNVAKLYTSLENNPIFYYEGSAVGSALEAFT
jgi:hypothetical protein